MALEDLPHLREVARMRWSALVLAGSRGPSDPVAVASGVSCKALARVGGSPMIDHVLSALADCPAIGKVAVSTSADFPLSSEIVRLPAQATPATSVLSAIDQVGTPLLVTTADNPLLSALTVEAFLADASMKGVDAVAAVAPREVVERAGNPGRRTYLKFRDEAVSGCNLFALTAPAGRRAVVFWRRLESERKRPWRMAFLIGPGTLIRYLVGSLSLDDATRAIGARAGCTAGIVRLQDQYAAHDVDNPEDLHFVEQIILQRSGAGAVSGDSRSLDVPHD